MGALHKGHEALLKRSREACDVSVASIFVNPLQFAPTEDFSKYPRTLDDDLKLCESTGVDFVYVPKAEDLVGEIATKISVGPIGDVLEGASRPGHFDGVATIVTKLLNIVRPDQAFFGLKDLQQCAVISQLVQDLNFNIRLEFVETVREDDGLALSSRNRYLSSDARKLAPELARTLFGLRDKLRESEDTEALLNAAKSNLANEGFEVDYLMVVDPATMLPAEEIEASSRIVAAVRLEGTRLIDNMPIFY
jgi:pantoate--beta-alanine ligase